MSYVTNIFINEADSTRYIYRGFDIELGLQISLGKITVNGDLRMSIKTRVLAAICVLSLTTTGCITVPRIEGDIAAKMDKLETAGKPTPNEKSPVLAGFLNIIPGMGQMYAGDYGDGVLTFLFFWTGYHYVMGFVDAVQETRVYNARYTIAFYEKDGFKFSLQLFGMLSAS